MSSSSKSSIYDGIVDGTAVAGGLVCCWRVGLSRSLSWFLGRAPSEPLAGLVIVSVPFAAHTGVTIICNTHGYST